MKIDEETRFPHPVLSAETGDYASGEFGIEFDMVETVSRAEVALDYHIKLTEPSIRQLVAEGLAAAGIFATCLDTYFNRSIRLGLSDSRFAFEPGSVSGRVIVRPLVWTTKPVDDFPLANCDPEFGGGSMPFPAGAILAIGEESVINVGHEKLAQMETIFTIAKSDELAGDTMSVNLDSDRIRIYVASDAYENVNALRRLSHGKPIILNSVYLPAVMEVLGSLGEAAATYEGKRWHKVFTAKCDALGIDPASPDLWKNAQKLLSAPYGEIRRNPEISGA